MEGCFTFQWGGGGGVVFQMGASLLSWRGHPMGGGFEKSWDWGEGYLVLS